MHHFVRHDVPFVEVNADGQIVGVSDYKSAIELNDYLDAIRTGTIAAPSDVIATHPDGGTLPGSLSGSENYDLIAVELTAGTTYSFAYRGTPSDGIEDPYLGLLNTTLTAFIAQDDDGGLGRTSQITFTPTTSGTYYLYATSWYTVAGYGPAEDTGNYTIDVWTADSAHDAPSTIEGAVVIDVGTNFGHLDAPGDVDVYSIEATEGMVYAFTYAGGISGGADWDGEPGENIGVVRIYDADGNQITAAANYETGASFYAEEGGTYYVRISGYEPEMTGGYTLDVEEVDPATRDPLESLNWDSAADVPFVDTDGDGRGDTAYVYFAPAGENFGELADDGVTPMTTFGWQQHEIDAVMLALEQYAQILNVNYEITTDAEQATFRMLTTSSEEYGAYAYPQAPAYGDQAGILVFNVDSGGWGAFPQSLEQGGFSFGTILHEFGHAHGIAHPHDTGGGSEVMLGVTASQGSFGVYDLNQGVYTVMSYNDAWQLHPDGPSSFTIAGIDNGWSGTLSPLDIAVLQDRYGIHDNNTGDDVYALTDDVENAFYQTIWDTGGTDTIAYNGELNAQIDLTAATLDYSPTGGGVVSFLHNVPGTDSREEVKGGYTIANGVVIENATGGSGHDVLIGNSANNMLTGNAGDDFLLARGGDDKLFGGDGDDELNGGVGNDQLFGGAGDDVFVFTEGGTDLIRDYESGEKIDLSGLGVTMDDVTIKKQFIQVELEGGKDLRIMFDTEDFSTNDLILGEGSSTSALSSASGGSSDVGDPDDSPFRPLDWSENSSMSRSIGQHDDLFM